MPLRGKGLRDPRPARDRAGVMGGSRWPGTWPGAAAGMTPSRNRHGIAVLPARTRGGVRRSLRYGAPRRSQGLWALQGKRIVRRQRVREVAMDWWIWLLIAVIVLAAVVIGAVVVQARRRRGNVISVQRPGRGGTSRARP